MSLAFGSFGASALDFECDCRICHRREAVELGIECDCQRCSQPAATTTLDARVLLGASSRDGSARPASPAHEPLGLPSALKPVDPFSASTTRAGTMQVNIGPNGVNITFAQGVQPTIVRRHLARLLVFRAQTTAGEAEKPASVHLNGSSFAFGGPNGHAQSWTAPNGTPLMIAATAHSDEMARMQDRASQQEVRRDAIRTAAGPAARSAQAPHALRDRRTDRRPRRAYRSSTTGRRT